MRHIWVHIGKEAIFIGGGGHPQARGLLGNQIDLDDRRVRRAALPEPEADADGETPDEDGVLPDVGEAPKKGARAKR